MKNRKKMILVTFLAVFAIFTIDAAACTACSSRLSQESTEKEKMTQTMCPVMNAPIDKNIFVEYEGKMIYFCCNSCVRAFNENPQKYIEIMNENKSK